MKVSEIQFPDTTKEFSAHHELRYSDTYRIYFADHWMWRYDVTKPGGMLIGCYATKWGAFRAIAKHAQAAKTNSKWWEQPYIAVDMSNGEE